MSVTPSIQGYDNYDGSGEIESQNWFWQKVEKSPGQSFGLVKNEILLHEKTTEKNDVVVFKK
jgi:hypothetical protein